MLSSRIGFHHVCTLLLVIAAASILFRSGRSGEADPADGLRTPAVTDDSEPEERPDPLMVNANCYVCHIPFVRESISKQHLAEKITCIECHGVSAGHVNDENIGATKPDITYRRDQVDALCGKCHKSHDVPVRDVLLRFAERKLKSPSVVCTDCHGHHRIEPPQIEEVPPDDDRRSGEPASNEGARS